MSSPPQEPNYYTVLDDYVLYAKGFVQKFGWPVVFTLVALYWAWPQIVAFQKQRALASANAPERRRVLDEARARVREQQQRELANSSAAAETDSSSKPASSTPRTFPTTKF